MLAGPYLDEFNKNKGTKSGLVARFTSNAYGLLEEGEEDRRSARRAIIRHPELTVQRWACADEYWNPRHSESLV